MASGSSQREPRNRILCQSSLTRSSHLVRPVGCEYKNAKAQKYLDGDHHDHKTEQAGAAKVPDSTVSAVVPFCHEQDFSKPPRRLSSPEVDCRMFYFEIVNDVAGQASSEATSVVLA